MLLEVVISVIAVLLVHRAPIQISVTMALHFRDGFRISYMRRCRLVQDDLAVLGETAHGSSYLA